MIRVISSPSSSTTGFFTLIFAMRACAFLSRLIGRRPKEWRPSVNRPVLRLSRLAAPPKGGAMSSLEKPDLVTTNVKWRWPSVHPEGRKFTVVAMAVAALFWWVIDWDWLGYLAAGLTLWTAAFFRDPIRTTPATQGLIIAAAAGLATMITHI